MPAITDDILKQIELFIGVTVGLEDNNDVVMHAEVPEHFLIADRLMEIKGTRRACVLVLPKVNIAPWKELLGRIPRQKVLTLPRGYRTTESTISAPVEVWWMYPLHTTFLEGYKGIKETGSPSAVRRDSKDSQIESELEVEEDEVPQSKRPVAGFTNGSSGALRCVVKIAEKPYHALVDTGACNSFISPDTVETLNLEIVPGSLEVYSAGNRILETLGTVSVVLEIEGTSYPVTLWVTRLVSGIAIILGCDWLQQYGVVIDMGTRNAIFPASTYDIQQDGNKTQRTSSGQVGRPLPETEVSAVEQLAHALQSCTIKEVMNCSVLIGETARGPREPHHRRKLLMSVDLFGRETGFEFELGEDSPLGIPHHKLQAILQEYSDVFPKDLPMGIPKERQLLCENIKVIPLEEGATPRKQRQYRLSPAEREELDRQTGYMRDMGWIRKSSSPWGSPVTFASKGEGQGLRLCVDLRAVNRVTIKNRTPLPRIDDLLDAVSGARIFTALDLAAGYHQIPLPPEECERTAFFGTSDLWEYVVMPFGLSNAPAVFSSFMTTVLGEFLHKFVLVYLDDILIYSKDATEHEVHVKLVLERFRQCKIYARAHKCRFNRINLPYLGHILSKDGIRPDPRKVQLVTDWPIPLRTVKEVEQFLGLTNYFRKYIRGYGPVTAPISDLRKKDAEFIWTPACDEAMVYLKNALTQAPLLAVPDFSEQGKQFEVICDASGLGIGAGLFQGDKIIAFEGRKYRPAEANYTVGEQELLSVVHALLVWRCYLEGAPKFKVVTDHNPLIWFNTQTVLSRRQSRWSEYLQRFDFEWCYRPGRMNVADPLSRAPTLREKPPEELHDGLVLVHVSTLPGCIESPAVGQATPPVEFQSSPVITAINPSGCVGQQGEERKFAAISAHSWLMIHSSTRGRLQLDGGEALRVISAAITRGRGQLGQELSDTLMDTEEIPSQSGVTPNSARTEVDHQDTPSIMGRYGVSEKHAKGQIGQQLSENAAEDVEMDVESLTGLVEDENHSMPMGSLTEQLEESSGVQGLLTEFLDLVKEGYQRDDWFNEAVNIKSLTRDLQGLYWRGHKLVIPDYAEVRRHCMRLCHDAPWAGHFGRDRTQQLVRQVYWWPKMDTEIEAYVKTCPSCQRNKGSLAKGYGLMVPTQIPERRWSSISTDFIIHLPRTSRGNDAIVLFVDRLSKRVHLAATRTKGGIDEFAEIFIRDIFANHGLPKEIISDRDRKFLSKFWERVTELLGVQRCLSTAFHPQTDGQTERMNRTLEEVLRSFVAPDQSDWDEKLPLVEFAMNNTVNSTIGTTPFLMEYGQEPLTPASLPIAQRNSKAFKFIANWENRVKEAKQLMQQAQHRQKGLYDRKVQEKSFDVGQWVMVSTRNMRMKGSKTVRRKKLTAKFAGPFRVRRKIGAVAYDLELPAHSKIHPVFHVGLLKEFYSDKYRAAEAPVVEFEDGEEYATMKQIIEERKAGKAKLTQYLVRWDDGDESWAYEDDLMEDAPKLTKSLIRKFRLGKEKGTTSIAKPGDQPKRPVGRPPGKVKRPVGRPRKYPSTQETA